MPSPLRHASMDKLSQRASTGLAIRRGEVKISDPIPSSYVHNGAEMDGAFEQPTPRLEGTWPRSARAGTMHGRNDSSSQPVHISRFTERTSVGPSLAASNMSSTPSKDPTTPRKNAGIRASIRRMFSKKERAPATQQRSALQTTPNRARSMGLSQQLNEYKPSPLHYSTISSSRALHSHAPSAHLRGESEGTVQHETISGLGNLGKRRNTEPSLLLPSVEEPAEPEFKSIQTQAERLEEAHSPERPATAIRRTTPPPKQLKRRSRSADALADLLRSPRTKTSDRRDRAEEIAFWRKSVVNDPLPMMSNTESAHLQVTKSGQPAVTTPSRPPRPSFEPIQDFDFGLETGTIAIRPVELQERVNTLEVKLHDFEYALAKLQGTDVTQPNLPKKKPSKRKSLRDAFPESGNTSAQESSSNDSSYLSTPSDRWIPSSPRANFLADRTSKATTIKATHRRMPSNKSQGSSHSSIRFTREQYDTLCSLIEDEKAARQHMEMQIMNLQKEVGILKAPVYAYVRPTKYSTPSPESSHEHTSLATPRLLHRSPALRPKQDLNETSRFSMTETESDTDADESYPEIFETPQENNFSFEARGNSPPGMI